MAKVRGQDATFAVNNDTKSHTGAIMSLVKVTIKTVAKSKIKIQSSSKAEQASMHDILSKVMWKEIFLKKLYRQCSEFIEAKKSDEFGKVVCTLSIFF